MMARHTGARGVDTSFRLADGGRPGGPGPFTSGCTKRHLPGYVTNLAAFKQKGVDAVVCVAVADAFVMHAWREANKVPAELVFLGPCGPAGAEGVRSRVPAHATALVCP